MINEMVEFKTRRFSDFELFYHSLQSFTETVQSLRIKFIVNQQVFGIQVNKLLMV